MQLQIDETIRRSFTYKFWRAGIHTLTAVQLPLLERVMDIDPVDLKQRVPYLLNAEPMQNHIIQLWTKTGGTFAAQTERKIRGLKSNIPDMELKDEYNEAWDYYFTVYSNQRSKKVIGSLMNTQAESINKIIDGVIDRARTEGLSIYNTQRAIRAELESQGAIINHYQAERIARTEVIGASNKGSFDAALSTDLVRSKAWRTSGLPGIRDSHLYYESLGDVSMNYEYSPGLQYPGDPAGSPDEIINCRCTHILNVD